MLSIFPLIEKKSSQDLIKNEVKKVAVDDLVFIQYRMKLSRQKVCFKQ